MVQEAFGVGRFTASRSVAFLATGGLAGLFEVNWYHLVFSPKAVVAVPVARSEAVGARYALPTAVPPVSFLVVTSYLPRTVCVS
jgi:hypothetical protein